MLQTKEIVFFIIWASMLVACSSVLENFVLTIDTGSNDDRIGFLCDASRSFTTGVWKFAVYPRHMAKPRKHSAKALQCVTLGKQHSAYTESVNVSLPSVFHRALGKDFAEC